MLARLPTCACPVEVRATRLHLLLPSCTSSISAALRFLHTARSGASESRGGTGEQVGGPAGAGASCSCGCRGLCIASGWLMEGWEGAGGQPAAAGESSGHRHLNAAASWAPPPPRASRAFGSVWSASLWVMHRCPAVALECYRCVFVHETAPAYDMTRRRAARASKPRWLGAPISAPPPLVWPPGAWPPPPPPPAAATA